MASPREEGELQETSSSSEEETDDEDNAASAAQLKFKNDGSFLEMFKKMQEGSSQQAKETSTTDAGKKAKDAVESSSDTDNSRSASSSKDAPAAPQPAKKPGLMSIVGKRRGGKALPVGVVKKQKKPEDEEDPGEKKDAWSQYLSEVKKYKERLGDEEEKNRPLVK